MKKLTWQQKVEMRHPDYVAYYKKKNRERYERLREEILAKKKAKKLAATPEEKARQKEKRKQRYLRNRTVLIAKAVARQKAIRSTPEGRERRNAAERAYRAKETIAQRNNRTAINKRAREKRLANPVELERERERLRLRMCNLRKSDEAYKEWNRRYQAEWRRNSRAKKKLDAEFDAFMQRLEREESIVEVNNLIAKKSASKKKKT